MHLLVEFSESFFALGAAAEFEVLAEDLGVERELALIANKSTGGRAMGDE